MLKSLKIKLSTLLVTAGLLITPCFSSLSNHFGGANSVYTISNSLLKDNQVICGSKVELKGERFMFFGTKTYPIIQYGSAYWQLNDERLKGVYYSYYNEVQNRLYFATPQLIGYFESFPGLKPTILPIPQNFEKLPYFKRIVSSDESILFVADSIGLSFSDGKVTTFLADGITYAPEGDHLVKDLNLYEVTSSGKSVKQVRELEGKMISDVVNLPDGHLLIATLSQGIYEMDGFYHPLRHTSFSSGLPSNKVTALIEGWNHIIWVVTAKGMVQMDLNSPFSFYSFQEQYGQVRKVIDSEKGVYVLLDHALLLIDQKELDQIKVLYSSRSIQDMYEYKGSLHFVTPDILFKVVEDKPVKVIETTDTYFQDLQPISSTTVLNISPRGIQKVSPSGIEWLVKPSFPFENIRTSRSDSSILIKTNQASYQYGLSEGQMVELESGIIPDKNILLLREELDLKDSSIDVTYVREGTDSYWFALSRTLRLKQKKVIENVLGMLEKDFYGQFTHLTVSSIELNHQTVLGLALDVNRNLLIFTTEGVFTYDLMKQIKPVESPDIFVVNTNKKNGFGGVFLNSTDDQRSIQIGTLDKDNPFIALGVTGINPKHVPKYRFKDPHPDSLWSSWYLSNTIPFDHFPNEDNFYVQAKIDSKQLTKPTLLEFTQSVRKGLPSYISVFFIVLLLAVLFILYRAISQYRGSTLRSLADQTEEQKILLEQQAEELDTSNKALIREKKHTEEARERADRANQQFQTINHLLEERIKERTRAIRIANKEMEAALKELDQLVYRISHDLKGPIARMLGLTQLASWEILEPSSREYIIRMDVVAKEMDAMLDKLLTVNILNQEGISTGVVKIEEVLERVEGYMETHYRLKRFDLIFDCVAGLEVVSDKELLYLMIKNLVENSFNFRKVAESADHSYVRVEAQPTDDGIQIEVTDNGEGIQRSHLRKIYDMFFRGSENSKGDGLGLYVVKKATDRLKGTIQCNSEFAEFTTFTIQIPNLNAKMVRTKELVQNI